MLRRRQHRVLVVGYDGSFFDV